MHSTQQIVINRPRDVVVDLIRNPDYFEQWRPGLKRVALLSGEPHAEGARYRVAITVPGFQLEMIETTVLTNPPELFVFRYEARGVKNLVRNQFFADSPETTRWMVSNSFQFSGLMAAVGMFVGDIVPKQTTESMRRFKHFAERM